MKEQEPFRRAGLYPANLPEFANGYNVGSQIWVYDQPSDYYRRHLLLHEGTHAFMLRWLGGAGRPGTWKAWPNCSPPIAGKKQVQLAIMPQAQRKCPTGAASRSSRTTSPPVRGLSLIDIMKYDAHAHSKVEAYGWCWAAAWFLDHHPLTKPPSPTCKNRRATALEFSKHFYEKLKNDWPRISEDWQIFTTSATTATTSPVPSSIRKPVTDLPQPARLSRSPPIAAGNRPASASPPEKNTP